MSDTKNQENTAFGVNAIGDTSRNVAVSYGIKILNRYGELVPQCGGVLSRNLFENHIPFDCVRSIDRGGIPTVWWLVASLAMIALGVWLWLT